MAFDSKQPVIVFILPYHVNSGPVLAVRLQGLKAMQATWSLLDQHN